MSGRAIVRALLVVWVVLSVIAIAKPQLPVLGVRSQLRFESWPERPESEGWEYARAALIRRLTEAGGKHLVIVQYSPNHDPDAEWVHNGADIDHSAVVWARDMGTVENARLLRYFRDRRPWLLRADARPWVLVPYPAAPEHPGAPRSPGW